ncbi:MAG: fumarylacetoacetate hydrolase family protein [Rhodospirillales bacterium]|nr:fumarylacetoacetate hydrolase family protein [Rhodospirillales bacterium]
MIIARYQAGTTTTYGIREADGCYRRLAGSPFDSLSTTATVDGPDAIRLLAPVMPPRIFGVGLNYVSHIKESGHPAPTFPMLFMKPPTAVIGPGDAIIYPRQGQEVHFEGELAAVIGRSARRIPENQALGYVLGYTCANDVSERKIQFAEMATGCLLVGKSFDTFCPLGPVIASGLDPANLELKARVNGRPRQSINTSDLLFSVARLVAYLSDAITLLPGDVIITGTPAGVGPVQPGDTVDIEISGIGVLSNPVAAEA